MLEQGLSQRLIFVWKITEEGAHWIGPMDQVCPEGILVESEKILAFETRIVARLSKTYFPFMTTQYESNLEACITMIWIWMNKDVRLRLGGRRGDELIKVRRNFFEVTWSTIKVYSQYGLKGFMLTFHKVIISHPKIWKYLANRSKH